MLEQKEDDNFASDRRTERHDGSKGLSIIFSRIINVSERLSYAEKDFSEIINSIISVMNTKEMSVFDNF